MVASDPLFDPREEEKIVEKIVEKIEDKIGQPGASVVQWMWRLVVLAVCAAARPDWISGFLTGFGWTFWQRTPVVTILAETQVIYYFYFFHWLSKEMKNVALTQAVKLLEESKFSHILFNFLRIFKKLKITGILFELKDLWIEIKCEVKQLGPQFRGWFFHKANRVINPENKPIKFIKAAGYPGLFLASCSPFGGWRSIPAAFCGSINWRAGLYALMAGNVVNVTYSQLIWSLLKTTFGSYFWPFLIAFYIFSIFFTIGISKCIYFIQRVYEKNRKLKIIKPTNERPSE